MTTLAKEEKKTMEKLDPKKDGASPDVVAEITELFRELAPEIFLDGKMDVDAVKCLFGETIEDAAERYSFQWAGKARSRRIAQAVSTGTLLPCPEDSLDWATTENIFIEGDNLEVLKLLQKAYHRKIRLIYIDPPYNTGNEFIYPDKYQDNLETYLRYTGQVDAEGFKVSTNTEQSGRYHTNWLNMMYPRLKLARNLLTDDGVILVSIDDNEASNLRKLCDEVFGEENFIAQFVWRSRKFTDARSLKNVSTDHEYILAYGKSDTVAFRGRPRDESKYSNPDDDPRGPWMSRSILGLATKDQRPNLHYDIVDPKTGVSYSPPANTGWRYSSERMEQLIADEAILFPAKPTGRPREKKFRADIQSEFTSFPTVIDDVHTSDGTQTLRELFGTQIFDFPKPVQLVQRFIEQCLPDGGIVLDFFAGACATAEAALRYQLDSEKPVRYIVVQLPEPCEQKSEAYRAGYKTISALGRDRIRRVAERLRDESAESEDAPLLAATKGEVRCDLGMKVFRLASSNIKAWDADFDALDQALLNAVENVKPERSEDDVLYELLLKYGLDLAIPIESRKVKGKKVYIIGAGALVVCLAAGVTLEVVEGIAALKGELKPEVMRVVFRDAGFADDVVKTNTVQILKQAGIDDVKSL